MVPRIIAQLPIIGDVADEGFGYCAFVVVQELGPTDYLVSRIGDQPPSVGSDPQHHTNGRQALDAAATMAGWHS